MPAVCQLTVIDGYLDGGFRAMVPLGFAPTAATSRVDMVNVLGELILSRPVAVGFFGPMIGMNTPIQPLGGVPGGQVHLLTGV